MAYLFDTDILSQVFRPRANVLVSRRFAAVPPHDQFTSAITFGEMLFGARRHRSPELVERACLIAARIPILSFDRLAADVFGGIKADLERTGQPLAEPDLRLTIGEAQRGDGTLRRLPLAEIENNLVGTLEAAEGGETIIVTRDGKPLAVVGPATAPNVSSTLPKPNKPGGILSMLGAFDDWDTFDEDMMQIVADRQKALDPSPPELD